MSRKSAIYIDQEIYSLSPQLTLPPQPSSGVGGIIYGSIEADTIVGGIAKDSIFAGPGEDVIYGYAGNDLLGGGMGDDIIRGGSGDDRITGGQQNDLLFGGVGSDLMYGGKGNDTVYGSEGDDEIQGAIGDDFVFGGDGADVVRGGRDNDMVDAGLGKDEIRGGMGNDHLYVYAGFRGQFNDAIYGGLGFDVAHFRNFDSSKNFFATYKGSEGIYADLTLGKAYSFGAPDMVTALFALEGLEGSSQNDVLIGNAADNYFWGGKGADQIDGVAGINTASYEASESGVTVDLSNNVNNKGGDAEGDILLNISHLLGGAFADTLRGDAGVNRLDGGAGDDILDGGAGADLLIGGQGNNTASYGSSAEGLTIDLGNNTNNTGDAQGDVLQDISNLIGSAFADTIGGDAGANQLYGGAGDDNIMGGGGADRLLGAEGNDSLYGDGEDILMGGLGDDHFYNSDGVNVVSYAGDALLNDQVTVNYTGGSYIGHIDVVRAGSNDAEQDFFTGINNFIGGAGASDWFTLDATTIVSGTIDLSAGTFEAIYVYGDGQSAVAIGEMSAFENAAGGIGSLILIGNDQSNILKAGSYGNETLTGGGGSDTFSLANLFYTDNNITDFEVDSGGDKLDLHDLLANSTDFDQGDVLSDFVRISQSNGQSTIELFVDALHASENGYVAGWNNAAVLGNVSVTLEDLVINNQIIV